MRLSVGTKLLVGFAVVIVVAVAVGAFALSLASHANERADEVFREQIVPLTTIAETIADANEVRRMGLLHTIVRDRDEQATLEERIDDRIRAVERNIDGLLAAAADPASRQATQQLGEEWSLYVDGLLNDLLPVSREGDAKAAQALASGQQSERFVVVTARLEDLTQDAERTAAALIRSERRTFETGRNQVVGVLAVAALLGLVLAAVISRSVGGNVREVARAATALARGDLEQRATVRSRDETAALADAFNEMAERLQTSLEKERTVTESLQAAVTDYSVLAAKVSEGDLTVRLTPHGDGQLSRLAHDLNGMVEGLNRLSTEVRDGAHGIGSAGAEILAAATQHAAGATEQSAAIAEVAATIEEVHASAEQTSRKAEDVARLADRSAAASEDGSEAVAAILTAMEGIKDKVATIAQDILALSEQTQQIDDITSTVNEIADQSNLLALNAAIEAAKAGEQGKGFAVVAAEVRSLAEQSKDATAQVRTILGDIRKASNAAVLATEEGSGVVETGVLLAQRAGEVIAELTETITRGSESVRLIAVAASQQSIGVDQISTAMREIDRATSQAAAGARQSQEAAQSLDSLARSLQESAGRYRV